MHELLQILRGKLVVSVQSEPPEPLSSRECLLAMAQTCLMGGASGIRTNRPEVIRLMAQSLDVPVIGIWKRDYPDSDVGITPLLEDALAVAEAGADIVAIDATSRKRPANARLSDIVRGIREQFPNLLLIADIAVEEEAETAIKLGFDGISTTLSGYTEHSPTLREDEPDFKLLEILCRRFGSEIPIIAEGRFSRPEQVARARQIGAHSIVIGSAITRPHLITRRFTKALLQ